MLWLVNPDEEILDWKAVCGKTARTIRRVGKVECLFPIPNKNVILKGILFLFLDERLDGSHAEQFFLNDYLVSD